MAELDSTGPVLTWIVRALYGGSAVAYLAHLCLVWRRVRRARALSFGLATPPPRRRRVTVRADILLHDGEPFLLGAARPAPDE